VYSLFSHSTIQFYLSRCHQSSFYAGTFAQYNAYFPKGIRKNTITEKQNTFSTKAEEVNSAVKGQILIRKTLKMDPMAKFLDRRFCAFLHFLENEVGNAIKHARI
jgi:hypothetical protein